jgi:hypothetical protein
LSWTHSQNFTLIGDVQEYRQTGTTVESHTFALTVDQPQAITVPDDNTLLTLEVNGYTGYKYILILPQADPHHLINSVPQGNTIAFSAIVPAPQF